MGEPRDRMAKRKRTKELVRDQTRKLGDRGKELHCLYGISNLVLAPDISLEEMLQGTVDLIPPGWQYPEVTCARITLDGREFRTDSFRETVWRQASDIIVNGERSGAIEVCHLEEEPEADEGPFLKEERDLIDAIAGRLGRVIERWRAEEALRSHAGELEELNRRLVQAYEELDGSRTQLVEKSALLQSLVEAHVRPLSEQLQETSSIILSRLAGFVPADAFALAIVSEDQPQVLIFAPARLSRRVTDEIRLRMSKAAEVVLGRKLSRTTPSGFEPIAGGSAKVGSIRSQAILPLTSSELETQVLGGMFSGKADAFEDDHVALFVAAGISLASRYLARIVHAKEQELQWRQSEFVATVSHELRTPIHSIWGFVKLLLAGKVEDENVRLEFLGIVDSECAQLTALVGDFLDVSKIEAGRMEMRRELFSLDELVAKTVAAFKTVADDRALTIDTDLPGDLPPVEGDSERLGQVLTNLLSNASNFSEDGGTIMVRARVEGPELVVSVQDQGIGIAIKAQPHLFERFYQVDDSRTRWQGGAGLGLYISRQIVEAHGGRIWVDSNVGEGSTFSFAIPVAASDDEDTRNDKAA